MSRRSRAIIFVVVTLAMIAVMAWILFEQRELVATPKDAARSQTRSDDREAGTQGSDADDTVESTVQASSVRHARYPPGEDPTAVIAALLPAAHAGDAAAACRVAVERLACDAAERGKTDFLSVLQKQEEESVRESRRAADAAMSKLLVQRADRYAALQVALLERSDACARIPGALRDDGIDWLARAAASGHPESVLRYATGQSLGYLEWLEQDESIRWRMLGEPHFEAWRRDAPRMLQRMIDAGRPEAAFVLFFAYSDDTTPLSGIVRDDPVEAAAMRLLMRDASPHPTHSDPLRRLDAGQRRAAMSRFEALKVRLAGGRLDRRLLENGLEPAPLSLIGTPHGAAPPCLP